MRFLDVWYTRFDADKLLAELAPRVEKAAIKSAQKALAKAQTRTSLGSLSKYARAGRGRLPDQAAAAGDRAPARDDVTTPSSRSSARGLTDYASTLSPDRRVVLDHYHYEDFARKVVGVGSVGTEALMILLMGDREDDPLFLQIKEANASVLAPYVGASEYDHQGERVVHGQRLMQAASDAFLGWVTGAGERRPRVLCAPVARHEGLGRGRGDAAGAAGGLRRALRRHVGARARAHRRRGEDHRLPRRRRHVRPCHSNASPSPTPTRTTPTTRRSPRPRRNTASRSNAMSDQRSAAAPLLVQPCLDRAQPGGHLPHRRPTAPRDREAAARGAWRLRSGPRSRRR